MRSSLFRSRLAAALLGLTLCSVPVVSAQAQVQAQAPITAPSFTRTEDVVYGRKYGTALTLDVFRPTANPNGLGVIWVVSGGWYSSHDSITPNSPFVPVRELIKRGYTVFAVVHGSQPKYTIPEILRDMNRAVRFIRFHAADYKISPDHLGITGSSAGGHLSLMQGMAGDLGDPKAADPIDRVSSRVQAVACFFPPTDFMNFGRAGNQADGKGPLKAFRPPFDFHEPDPANGGTFERITHPAKITAITRQISPILSVTPDDPPTRIIHGDADPLVPLQQSETMVAALKSAGIPTDLIIKKGGGHGWEDMGLSMPQIVDWFDTYLKK